MAHNQRFGFNASSNMPIQARGNIFVAHRWFGGIHPVSAAPAIPAPAGESIAGLKNEVPHFNHVFVNPEK
jgi:hypothetical protein